MQIQSCEYMWPNSCSPFFIRKFLNSFLASAEMVALINSIGKTNSRGQILATEIIIPWTDSSNFIPKPLAE